MTAARMTIDTSAESAVGICRCGARYVGLDRWEVVRAMAQHEADSGLCGTRARASLARSGPLETRSRVSA